MELNRIKNEAVVQQKTTKIAPYRASLVYA